MAVRDRSPTDAEYRARAELRHLIRSFLAFSDNAARQTGLPGRQYEALLAIKAYAQEPTVGELARRLAIRPNSAVGLVDRLVAAGLLRRAGGGDDRRHVRLALTQKAQRLLQRLSSLHHKELRRVAPLLIAILRLWRDRTQR